MTLPRHRTQNMMTRLALLLGALCGHLANSAQLLHREASLSQAQHALRADPKKEPAKKEGAAPKDDLNKKMTLKAAEQGFEGKQVQHKNGKTGTADWHSEYGDDQPRKAPAPKKSGSMRCSVLSTAFLLTSAALWLRQ